MISKAITQSKGRIVVIGGGYAGATAAKYLRSWSNGSLDVIMVEPRTQFVSCPLSNLVLGGTKNINELTFGYDMLKSNHGIQWVSDEVVAIDTSDRVVKMKRGELAYDRLIIAPGIDFMYEQLPVLQSEEAQLAVPHAWKAGVQTVNLRKQLESMKDGGVFVISIPKAPYRCPPGPYERVSQVAFYLKNHKPNSKIIVLDANAEIISKKGLFTKVWAEMYAGMIDYRPNSSVVDVDVVAKTVKTEFESVRADVLNVIPPQRAGKIAQIAGVANVDKRWCEVDFLTYESKIIPNVHLIGDSVSAALPKSAHMATSQARVCANAIVALMSNQLPDSAPVFANTCYSYVSDKMAMHVANVYRYDPNKKIMVSAEGGGVSEKPSELEGNYAQAWAKNIWSDVLT
jgi:NADPH-dependent 2,4-dienoyl-CoA reductase/sulfur reductase-like enzyme